MAMKVSKVFGVRPLPDEFYKEIGAILVEWTWLEYRTQEAIWHLLNLKSRADGRVLTVANRSRDQADILPMAHQCIFHPLRPDDESQSGAVLPDQLASGSFTARLHTVDGKDARTIVQRGFECGPRIGPKRFKID